MLHAPAEFGHASLSDAMVDLRDSLLAATTDGIITLPEAHRLAQRLKALPFGERSLAAITSLGAGCIDPASLPRLRAWLPGGAIPRKRLDALALLDELAMFLAARPEPFEAPFRFEHVQAWHDFVTTPDRLTAEEALVLEEARLCADDWDETVRAALGRFCAIGVAPASTADGARLALDRFRLKRGLIRRADLDDWLTSNAGSYGWLERVVGDEASVTASLTMPPPGLDGAIVDHLRLTDRFAGLLRRALAKRDGLAAHRPPEPGPSLDAALSWYAERSGRSAWGAAPDVWPDEPAFRRAVWREWLFVHAAAR